MGVYIPNKKMPKGCVACSYRACVPNGLHFLEALEFLGNIKDREDRPTDCPLIEIDQEDEEAVLFLARMRKDSIDNL